MRNLFIGQSDFAASGNMFAMALATQPRQEVQCVVCRSHIFEYPQQGRIIGGDAEARELVAWANRIWIIQSDLPRFMGDDRGLWLKRMRGKEIILLHGGSHYRDDRQHYAKLWQDHYTLSICYSSDLMGGFEREVLILPPANLNYLHYVQRPWSELRVGHFPARAHEKGSEWIVPALANTEGIVFSTSVKPDMNAECVSWLEQVARMQSCDVVVDQIKPSLGPQRFGEWVSLAMEASALGRIAIANSLDTGPYVETYGRLPGIHICNSETELRTEIDRLKGLSETRLIAEQEAMRDWVETHHSFEATGKILTQCMS